MVKAQPVNQSFIDYVKGQEGGRVRGWGQDRREGPLKKHFLQSATLAKEMTQ